MDARWMNQTPTEPLALDVMHVDVNARKALRRQVKLRCDVVSHYWESPVEHVVSDVSPHGMWVDTFFPLHPGAELVLCFTPPGGAELMVFGQVRRVVTGRRRKDRGRLGMGIEFTRPSANAVAHMSECLNGIPPRRSAYA